jgi:beta-phosphoglucomutase-like phosphatase (HAD superfamily)/GTP:adenosylcobinamide-phosphate guanylyltransferase
MNIIIPLGGSGERFKKNGYKSPKPLIKVFDKCIIEYVIDNLDIHISSRNITTQIFIIYNKKLNTNNFREIINDKYPNIILIEVNDTQGPVETLKFGIDYILENNLNNNLKTLVIDCDTFYTQNIIQMFDSMNSNSVFYVNRYNEQPLYSYIDLNETNVITKIVEKQKISNNANTGAYAFLNIKELYNYCNKVIDNNYKFNNEYYTSCLIDLMIKDKNKFVGIELDINNVFSLGTPKELDQYINRTHGFLFDLDGTLVNTDSIYKEVWKEILKKFNINLTDTIFNNYIQGNNDNYVINSLLYNIDVNLNWLSEQKDKLFLNNIDKINIIESADVFITNIKNLGHKIGIVTNSNRNVAIKILQKINIYNLIDYIISSNDVLNAKPDKEPYSKIINLFNIDNNKCIIFEDSKSGLLSAKKVYPKHIIGIETNYDSDEFEKYGISDTIKNYSSISIKDIIGNTSNNLHLKIKEKILQSLINNKKYSDINIQDIIINTNKLKGGFIADVISFKINLVSNESIYILKYETQDTNNLSIMASRLNLYNREYYFYTDIANTLDINIPNFINLVYNNDKSKKEGIILENLFSKGYKVNLNLNSISIDTSLKIVDRMAYLHSINWNKNLKKKYPKILSYSDNEFNPFIINFIKERKQIFINKWFKILNINQQLICEDIFENFNEIFNSFITGNLTFIHGDIKSPNIFYDINNNNEPYFIDWQHCAIGKGVQDLVFFIIESFDINKLKIVYPILKNYYYLKLNQYNINDYNFKSFEIDIEKAIKFIPFFTAVWFGTTPEDELIDKNFPYFLISKLFYLLEIIH